MNQAADELFRLAVDDRLLPRRELDLALVLPSRAMLREETRPRVRVGVDLDEIVRGLRLDRRHARGHDLAHRGGDLSDDPRVPAVHEDAQSVAAPPPAGDHPIAEVHAEQIAVSRLR